MQAATGLVQLRKLDGYIEARRRNAAYLSERLGDLDEIEAPFVAEYAVHSYYKYIGRLRPETGIDIARFVQAVAAEGVPISRRYPTPLPQQPVFREFEAGACPTAERLAGELFTLLVHPTVETADPGRRGGGDTQGGPGAGITERGMAADNRSRRLQFAGHHASISLWRHPAYDPVARGCACPGHRTPARRERKPPHSTPAQSLRHRFRQSRRAFRRRSGRFGTATTGCSTRGRRSRSAGRGCRR